MLSRDEDGKLIIFRGPDTSPGCQHCPCARNGAPGKAVRGHGPTGGLVVVGEGPGSEELFQGYPFIGPSGKLLTKACKSGGIDRQTMWITNALLCARPKDDTLFATAVDCCRPRLGDELRLVQPTGILALGGTAVRALKLPVATVIEARGTVQYSPLLPDVPVITTMHPAALLRGGAGEVAGGKQKMNVDAQMMFMEADVVKAYRVAMGQIAPAWSDDITVAIEPGAAPAEPAEPASPFTRAFLEFHHEHPEVYEKVVDFARQALGAGVQHAWTNIWGAAKFHLLLGNPALKIPAYQDQYAKFIATQEADLIIVVT